MFDALRAAFPPNRVVAFLAPFYATLAGLISAWLADHLPFIAEQVDHDELTAIFAGGAAAAIAAAYKWLEGWQQHENRQFTEDHPPA